VGYVPPPTGFDVVYAGRNHDPLYLIFHFTLIVGRVLRCTVHTLYGYSLMLAGLTRIIEVCFIPLPAPPRSVAHPLDDNDSEHTLAPPPGKQVPTKRSGTYRLLVSFSLTECFEFMCSSRSLSVTSCFRVCCQNDTIEPCS
jgi:hypothetical protein